jgi:hypothetical protein
VVAALIVVSWGSLTSATPTTEIFAPSGALTVAGQVISASAT